MLTVTITPRAVLLAAFLALAGVLAFYASEALGSSDPPDAYFQGDTNCDGVIDGADVLNNLRHTGGLDVGPFPNCPAIGSEAAIPGPQGPQGEQGPAGPQGPPGPIGVADLEVVFDESEMSSEPKALFVPCPDGKSALGGGAQLRGVTTNTQISASYPADILNQGLGWEALASEHEPFNPQDWSLRVYVVCADVAE